MRCGALAALLLLTGAARADDRVGEVADRVVAAVRDDATAALERLASQEHPDPWLVAEELCFRGAHDAAAAFAAAVKDEKLAAYVKSRRGREADGEARRALGAAERLRMGSYGEEAWATLSGIDRPGDPVLEIRLYTTQAKILRDLDRDRRSDRYFFHAGKLAHGLGWRRCAAAAFRACLSGSSLLAAQRRLRKGEATVAYRLVQGEVLATLVTSERVAFVPLGRKSEIEAACAKFRSVRVDRPVVVDAPHRALIEPLELEPEIRRLFIVPEYHFAELPFVLFAGDREIVYGRTARNVTAFRPWVGDRGQGVLGIALESRYGGEEALKEARAVGDTVLTGPALTLNAIEHAMKSRRRWRAVHVAGRDGLVEAMLNKRPLVPGLASERWNVDLLVLPIEASNAIRIGPAWDSPRRIHSLWRTDPEATPVLMTRFYELWNGEAALPACTALKRAQDHVRSQAGWKHPYYWAGWQLWASEDPEDPEKRGG